MTRYTIRYRATDRLGQIRLLVEDACGARYLFRDGRLHETWPPASPGHLGDTDLDGDAWRVVPLVDPYTLDELRRLTAPQPRNARAA